LPSQPYSGASKSSIYHSSILAAVVCAFFELHDFLGRKLGVLFRGKKARPVLRELVAAMLGDKETARGIEHKSLAVVQPGRIAFRRRETLIFFVGVIKPYAGAGFELGARPNQLFCDLWAVGF
jgi:hypothetical protein